MRESVPAQEHRRTTKYYDKTSGIHGRKQHANLNDHPRYEDN